MRPVSSWRALACALLVLASTACGAEQPEDNPNAHELRIVAADDAWAELTVLRAPDLEGSWTPVPEKDAAPEDCEAIDYSDLTVTGEATAGFEAPDDSMFIDGSVTVYRTAREAMAALERGDEADVAACMREVLLETITEETPGAELEDVVIEEVRGPRAGESSRQFRIDATLVAASETDVAATRASEEQVRGIFVIAEFVRGRALVVLGYSAYEREFPPAVAAGAAAAMDARIVKDPPPPEG